MTDKDIQKLIDRYLEGLTSPEEERLLARELLRPDIPKDWQAIRLMLGELTIGEAEYDDIVARRTKTIPIVRMRRRWIAVAASLILLIGIGAMVWNHGDRSLDSGLQPNHGPVPMIPPSAVTTHVARLVRTGRTESPHGTDQESARDGLKATPHDTEPQGDPNLRHAAYELTKDTVPYQDPARVDEFIAKLADYYDVKQGELQCSVTQDSNVVSSVYVFPDKATTSASRLSENSQEIDLFGQLLLVACWYDSKTSGYHLNFSQEQFFFELKDLHKQLQYRWIAERINGRILLYGTNAPIGVKASSACYQEYRNELMHINSINHKTKEI